MLQRLGLVAFVLGFLIATADAQPVSVTAEEQGRIARLDTAAGVVILEDGRMYRVTPGTVLLVDNRAVPFGQLRAGSPVVIRAGEHVALRDGQYVGAVAVPVAETGRVTPFRVSSPVTVTAGPSASMLVEANVIVGYCSASKKSAVRRWLRSGSIGTVRSADWTSPVSVRVAAS